MNSRFNVICLVCVIFCCPFIYGQSIVHIDNSRFNQEEEGWTGNFDLGVSFTQAHNAIFTTANASQLQYKKKKHSLISANALNLTVVNSNIPVNDGYQHLRYGYKLSNSIVLETFIQGQYNHNTKIKARFLGGSGVLFKIFEAKRDSMKLYTGVYYMPEYDHELSGLINRHHRMSTMVSCGIPLPHNAKFDFVFYLQPDFARLTDFRISTQASYEVPLLKKLLFRFTFAFFYDTHPPVGLRPVFFSAKNSLRYSF